jgi:predicted helicase
MSHMFGGSNLALITTRQTRDQFDAFATRDLVTHKCMAAYDINSLFPLYLYPTDGKTISRDQRVEDIKRQARGEADSEAQQQLAPLVARLFPEREYPRWPNLDPFLLADLEERLALRFLPDGQGDLTSTFGPEDVFNYIYAVLHCPTYRTRYAEFLKRDFPRVPFTSDLGLFADLAARGRDLAALHLMESSLLETLITSYPEPGSDTVERVSYSDNQRRVYINKTQYFDGIPKDVWEFHVGGYQVCDKWLKDRKGRKLDNNDLVHYQKIVVALHETIRLMAEIDALIPSWPLT